MVDSDPIEAEKAKVELFTSMAEVASARIPKKRNKEGITKADINNRDIQNLLADVNKKCLSINFHTEITVQEVYLLHNSDLQAAYVKKRTELKEEGRTSQSLTDQLGFLHLHHSQRSVIDRKGLFTRYMPYNRLGKGHLGVYLNRYFDVEVKQAGGKMGEDIEIFVFKYFSGKCKSLNIGNLYTKNSTVEPTPNYDSHISAVGPIVDEGTFLQKAKADIYLYEYDEECELVKRPRQCLPHAIIKVRLKPLPEKTIPAPTPVNLQVAGSRSAVEKSTPGAAPVAPTKQDAGQPKTPHVPSTAALQDIPSPFLKDSKHKAAAKERSKPAHKQDRQAKVPVDEKVREERCSSYLHRLSLAKATVEATQSKVLGGLEGLASLLHAESPLPPTQTLKESNIGQPNTMSPWVVSDQTKYHKPISTARVAPVVVSSSTPKEATLAAVNSGLSKSLDPRLARSKSNPAAPISEPRLDPRLARTCTDKKQAGDASWDLAGRPEAASIVPSKGVVKINGDIKKMSFSEYKKLKQDDLTKTCPDNLPTRPKDTTKPALSSTVLPMPITFMDTKKLPPKPSVPEKQTVPADSTPVPLPSFYKEYTPDEDYPSQGVDFNEFQSPVKGFSGASSSQFQSPISKPARNSPSLANASPSKAKKSGGSKTSLLPLPVINSDGSVSNVLRGLVDGAITEIKTPPQTTQPPQKAAPKLLIKPELINNMAKNLAKTVSSLTDTAVQSKNMFNAFNNNNNDNLDIGKKHNDQKQNSCGEDSKESQLSSKRTVDERVVKGLLKGFHKGLVKSDSSSQITQLENETQNQQVNKHTVIQDKECPLQTRAGDETSSEVSRQAVGEKNLPDDATKVKTRCVQSVDEMKEGPSQEKHCQPGDQDGGKGERKIIIPDKPDKDDRKQLTNVKQVYSPPPLPLIPFLVSDKSQTQAKGKQHAQQGELSLSTKKVDQAAVLTQSCTSTGIFDPLDSGMWVAPAMDELLSVVDFSRDQKEIEIVDDGNGLTSASIIGKCSQDDARQESTSFSTTAPPQVSVSVNHQPRAEAEDVSSGAVGLTLEELGFNNTLQVMSDLLYQPNTMMVDCFQAVTETCPLASCEECQKLLPLSDAQYVQSFMDSQNSELWEESDQDLQNEVEGETTPAANVEAGTDEKDTADVPGLDARAEKMDVGESCPLDKAAQENRINSSTEFQRPAVEDTHGDHFSPLTSDNDSGTSEPGSPQAQLQVVPATTSSITVSGTVQASQHVSSTGSRFHLPPSSTQPASKDSSLMQASLPHGLEGNHSMEKVSQNTEVLKPLDKMLNSHSNVEIKGETQMNTETRSEGKAKPLERSTKEVGQWRTWDQNCPFGKDMDNARLQKEQRKIILLQLLKQKEKIKKSFEKHSRVDRDNLVKKMNWTEAGGSQPSNESTRREGEEEETECNVEIGTVPCHKQVFEQETKKEGNDLRQNHEPSPMSSGTLQHKRRSEDTDHQVILPEQELKKAEKEVQKCSPQAGQETRQCEQTLASQNTLECPLTENKDGSGKFGPSTDQAKSKSGDLRENQGNSKPCDLPKEKKLQDERKERSKTTPGIGPKSYERNRNRSGSRDRRRNRSGSRERSRNRSGSRERRRNRSGSRERRRNRSGSRDRRRNKSGSRERRRNRSSSRERHRNRSRSRERDSYRADRRRRERSSRYKEESRDKSGSRERDQREKRARYKEESQKHLDTKANFNPREKGQTDQSVNKEGESQAGGEINVEKSLTSSASYQSKDMASKIGGYQERSLNVKDGPQDKPVADIKPTLQKLHVQDGELVAKEGNTEIREVKVCGKEQNEDCCESLSENDKNSTHPLQLNVMNASEPASLLATVALPNVETETSIHKDTDSQFGEKSVIPQSTESSKESSVGNNDSDEEFGAPKKIIQQVKKKILIKLPSSSQPVKTKVSTTSQNDSEAAAMVDSTQAATRQSSPDVSLSLSSTSSWINDTASDVSSLSVPTSTSETKTKPILTVEIPELNPDIEELYSPSNPTIEDQPNFAGMLKQRSDKSGVEDNQPGTGSFREAAVGSVHNASKADCYGARYPTDRTSGHRNIFSLYPDSAMSGHDFYSFENNDFGDVDYRQGNAPNYQTPEYRKSYHHDSRMDNFPSPQRERLRYGEMEQQSQIPQRNTDYHDFSSDDVYRPFDVPRPTAREEAGCWQGFHTANSNDFGDTDYRQQPELTPSYSDTSSQIKSEAHAGIWSTPYHDYPHNAEWRDQQVERVHTPSRNPTNEDYLSHSQPTRTNNPDPATTTSSLVELYNQSESPVETPKPVSETEAALQTLLPEMFSKKKTTHRQKCHQILKAFSQTNVQTEEGAFLSMAEDDDESDDEDKPNTKQALIKQDTRSPLSKEQQTASVDLQSGRTAELSSVDKLKEILATVKQNARISQGVKESQASNNSEHVVKDQGQVSDGSKELPPAGMIGTTDKEAAIITNSDTEHTPTPGRSGSKQLSVEPPDKSYMSAVDFIDQLVKKIDRAGNSLQNLTTTDMLKNVLGLLTEKVPASSSQTVLQTEIEASPDSEEKRAPVVSLSKVFQSSDMSQDSEDELTPTRVEVRGQPSVALGQDLRLSGAKMTPASETLSGKQGKSSDREKERGTSSISSHISVSGEKLKFPAGSDKPESDLQKSNDAQEFSISDSRHLKEKVESTSLQVSIDKNSRVDSKGEAGGLCNKVSASSVKDHITQTKSLEQSSTVSVSPLDDHTIESKKPAQSSSLCSVGSDTRVVVIDSSSSACDSPVVSNPPTATSSNLSISVRKDGKVYLSDVSMDVLAFAREKIRDQISELIEDTEEDTEGKAMGEGGTKDAGEENSVEARLSPQPDPSEDGTEDGEIKDLYEGDLSDVTVCRDEMDPAEVEDGWRDDQSGNDDVIEVSSDTDTDVHGQAGEKKTRRGVFCRKRAGPLTLSLSYIENCKKKMRDKKSRHQSKQTSEWEESDMKYSDISDDADSVATGRKNELQGDVTPPLKVQPEISSSGLSSASAKRKKRISFGDTRNILTWKGKKRRASGVLRVSSSVETPELTVAKPDSSSDWKRQVASSPPHRKRQSSTAQSTFPSSEISPLQVSSSVSDRKVVLKYAQPTSDIDTSPGKSVKKAALKVSSVVCRTQKLENQKSNTNKTQLGKTDVSAKVWRSLSRDPVKKRSVSPRREGTSMRKSSPTPCRLRSGWASRSPSRGRDDRRDRSSSSELWRGRSKSPRHSRLNRGRSSRSLSRGRHSRSTSLSPPSRYTESGGYSREWSSRDRVRERYSRYLRDSPPLKRKRTYSPRRSLSRSPSLDRSYTHSPGDRSPSSRKRFNNELDYYTSRQRSPVWKDLPSFSETSSSQKIAQGESSQGVDYLSLDYYTSKKRRVEVPSSTADEGRDTCVVQLATEDREPSEFEKLMKDYEKERQRRQHISYITIEKLILTHYGTAIQEEVRAAFPLSFETYVTYDIKGNLRHEEDMGKFGSMVLDAFGVASGIFEKNMGKTVIDFHSWCFDEESWDHYLQEFSDTQILLEVNVIKQCQAILHASQEAGPSIQEKLKENHRKQVTLKTQLFLMDSDRGSAIPQGMEEVKQKLASVEEEFMSLMQDCIKQKQQEASQGSGADTGAPSLPQPDLPEVLRVSTAEFQFCQLLHPVPDEEQKADLEALLDQVACDILELYKSPNFGRPHYRVPDLLLLAEEKRGLYAVCGTPLILASTIPKKTFRSLFKLRQQLERPDMRETQLGKKLMTERSRMLENYADAGTSKANRRARMNKLKKRVRKFTCCSDYLEKVLGSEGLKKLKVFQTFQNALQWHATFLEQEFQC